MNYLGNRIRIIGIGFILSLLAITSSAQNLSNRGREFWVSYPLNWMFDNGSNGQEMVLYFSAEQAATVTVTSYVGATTWVRTYNVPAGTVTTSDYIPKVGSEDSRLFISTANVEGLYNKGIHIESTVPIVVYAHYLGLSTSGGAMLFPVEAYGYSYTTLNNEQNYGNAYTYFYIMASEDNTFIEITPSVATRTRPAGVPYTVQLNKKQAYQVVALSQSTDLSGSKIRSVPNRSGDCLPIAVFCGSSRTTIGCSTPGTSGDFIMQQCFPSQAWGKRYLTAPTSNHSAATSFQTNVYRVLVKDPTTVVRRNGIQLTGLINNTFYHYTSNTADYIEADQPIMVAQYMASVQNSGCANVIGPNGDPEMIYLSPIEQAINRVGFYRNNQQNISSNYLTLIIPTAGVASLLIDGSSSFDHSYPHPNRAGYTVVIKRWGPAEQAQCIVQSASPFTAITYGLGNVESYGYNAGTLINNLNVFASLYNTADTTTNSHQYTCKGTPMELGMLISYKPTSMNWQLSQVPSITPGFDVFQTNPSPIDSQLINGHWYYRYKLPGTYSFSDTGTFHIPVVTTHPSLENCNNSETVRFSVSVRASPKADFTFSHTGCRLDSVFFTSPATSSNGYNINSRLWTFHDGTTATTQNHTKLYSAAGTFNVQLRVVAAGGCVGDTTRPITILNPPSAVINANPDILCEGGTVSFTGTSSYSGAASVSNWYWDFANGNTVNATNNNPQVINYPNYGSYTVKLVAKVSNTCISDTATRVITVNAKPALGFTYPAGCLPSDGVVQFTSTSTVPGNTVASYSWNFGDPNATPANPNTSTLANPTHIYTYGTYNIQYSVTSAAGCTKDTMITATFNVRPQLAYSALSPVCENVPGTVSVANGAVTNGVAGTGIYRGPATSTSGLFSPSQAGAGMHTIWYVFTSQGGCTDSISQTIQVYARPNPSFTFPAGCLPISGLVQFTNTSTIADAQSMTYHWDFGDPNANAGNPNTSTLQHPSHNYSNTGTYSIKLTATSSNGCTKDTVVTTTFSVRPQLSYPALAPVCESAGIVSVATAVVTNNVSGTGVYSGPGVTANGNFNPAIAGPGTHTIKYVFNSAGSCADSVTQTIFVHARPRPSFSFPTNTCLPINGLVQFQNHSTIADAQSMTYLWDFNDPNASSGNPNTSTAFQPSHNYTNHGIYNVKLTATSSNGCVGDTVIPATFSVRPQLSYPVLANVCENAGVLSVATASVLNGVTGNGVYSGPGVAANGNFNPSIAGPGTHTIKFVFTSTGNCVDSAFQTIFVNARPRPSFSFPTGCLPVTGLVQFQNNSSIADAQTMTYIWNFADPNANAGNPNTSTLFQPSHNYTDHGTYNVNLRATSSNGCIADTTIPAVFSVRPQLAYPALGPVCESNTATSVATATVTNNVNGTGVYRGPGMFSNGMFNPGTAGPGTHTIWYVFNSNGNCVDSISQTILVHPKPAANFTLNTDICLDGLATFTPAVAIGVPVTSWNWTFGDGNTAVYNNDNTFTRRYAAHGNYTAQLVTTSNNGCNSDPFTRTIGVHALPVTNFDVPAGVCMPNGTAAFINRTTIADNSTWTSSWNFGDGNSANTLNGNHVYATAGSYTVRLIVTSQFGCMHDTTKVLSSFFDKPVADFVVAPDTLCQGTYNVFTDRSFAPNSTVTAWNWSFGDGATSSQRNPTKRYLNPGNYDVRLTVTNAVGCTSEPYTDRVIVYLQPVIDAGPSFVVPLGTTIRFNPKANDSTVLRFSWSPGGDFPNPNMLRPSLVAMRNQTYTLTAIGQGNCMATDTLTVKILKPVTVPNSFTPNRDGINDTWVITNLIDYPGATVEVYNRYGQQVYFSKGYGTAWDGTFKGQSLPFATYYYIITLKNGFEPLTGSVTIVK